MKTMQDIITQLFLATILFLSLTLSSNAATLANDQFATGLDGYTGSGLSYYSRNGGWLNIARDTTASKTYDFGAGYANKTLSVAIRFYVNNEWETSGPYADYFNVLENGTIIQSYQGDGASYIKSFNVTTDATGKVTLGFNPNSTANNENAYVDYVTITDNALPNLCPGTVIPNLDGTSVTAADSFTNVTVPANTTYYYHFTPAANGTIQVNSSANKTYNSLYIKDGCSGSTLWSNTSNSTNKSSPQISVTAGQQIVIAYQRRYGSSINVNLDFTYTVFDGIVDNADDLCYEEPTATGLMCFNFGICSGGIGCKNTYPLRNIGASTLNSVTVFYDETGLGGSFGGNCGVDPSGSCQTVHGIDFGPFGFFGTATQFNLNNAIAPNNNSNSIWASNFMSGSCFNGEKLYGSYIKDGKLHRGKIKACTPTPINAIDDHYTTNKNTALIVDIDTGLFSNDSGNGITITATDTSNLQGTVDINETTGSFTYTPPSGWSGTTTFTYTITDIYGNSATATVTIDVTNETEFESSEGFERINPPSTYNIIGNYKIAGNTVLCLTTNRTSFATSESQCVDTTNMGYDATSNNYIAKFIDIDGDRSTWNSSSSYINFPASTQKILWAALVWQGRFANSSVNIHYADPTNGNWIDTDNYGSGDFNEDFLKNDAKVQNILLKVGTGPYQTVNATKVRYNAYSSGITYSAWADVTQVVQQAQSTGKSVFTVANLQTSEGREPTPGIYGGWSLVVIYAEDITQGKPHNLSVYAGMITLNGNTYGDNAKTIDITGFKLPSVGNDVSASLSLFSGEGEEPYKPDGIQISSDTDPTWQNMPGSSDPNNIFDAVLDGVKRDNISGHKNNLQNNNVGVDVDDFNLSTILSGYDRQNTKKLTLKMYSKQDYIIPGMLAFSVELYIPKLCYDYTLDIDGYVLSSANNVINTAFGSYGKDLTSKFYIRSLEGDLPLQDVNVTYRAADTSQISYIHGSTEIADNSFNYVNAAAWTVHESNAGFTMYIGDGKTGSSGGQIGPREQRYIKLESTLNKPVVNTTFDFGINFKVNYGSGGVPIHQSFTEEDLCPSSGGGFQPTYGIFNVIDGSATTYDEYNLYTQVSGRPFTLQIYGHDAADPTQPVANDLNLSVEVELIRADNFAREADVACNDEKGVMPGTTSKFVFIKNAKKGYVTYHADDINFAYRSLATRVWYFTYADGALVQDHNCTRDNQTECVRLYNRDFSSEHACDAACDSSGSGCYDCLRAHYASRSCSRDNFAVRPESFVVEFIDSNEKVEIDLPHNTIANSRNSSDRTHVVAGYKYRFDVNATSHTSDSAVPQYRVAFSPSTTTQRSQMVSDFKNNFKCNDPEDKNISIVLFDGSSVNPILRVSNVDKVEQIGTYSLHIEDSSWTAADWDPALMPHHNNGHFAQGTDCATNSDQTLSQTVQVSNANQNGCVISTDHTNPDGATYSDLAFQFYPYKFNIDELNVKIRASRVSPASPIDFIYINTPARDHMAYNIIGTYKAVDYNDNQTTNFVGGCFADDTELTLDANTTTSKSLDYHLTINNETEKTGNVVYASEYQKDMNGSLQMDIGYNYEREQHKPQNPFKTTFKTFKVKDVGAPSDDIYVDLKRGHEIVGKMDLNDTIMFLYGRLHAPRYRVADNTGSLPVYYEFYYDKNSSIDGNLDGNFSSNAQRSRDAIYWYTNVKHGTRDGNITDAHQYNRDDVTLTPDPTVAGGKQSINYTYSGNDFPYRATILLETQPWLIYQRYPSSSHSNELEAPLEIDSKTKNGSSSFNDSGDDDAVDAANRPRRIQW